VTLPRYSRGLALGLVQIQETQQKSQNNFNKLVTFEGTEKSFRACNDNNKWSLKCSKNISLQLLLKNGPKV